MHIQRIIINNNNLNNNSNSTNKDDGHKTKIQTFAHSKHNNNKNQMQFVGFFNKANANMATSANCSMFFNNQRFVKNFWCMKNAKKNQENTIFTFANTSIIILEYVISVQISQTLTIIGIWLIMLIAFILKQLLIIPLQSLYKVQVKLQINFMPLLKSKFVI